MIRDSLDIVSRLPLCALWTNEHDHSFTLEVWHILRLTKLLQVRSKSRQEQFTLLFEDDRTSAEEDIGLHFVAFLEEFLGMLKLEVIIMIIGLRSKTNLFNFLLFLVGFRLFLLFLLRVEELLVVDNTTNRRVGSRRNLDEVKILLIGYVHSLLKGVNTLLYIIAYEAHLQDTADFIIDTMRVFFDNTTATRSLRNSCYFKNV